MKNLFILGKNAGYNCSYFATKLLALGLGLCLGYGANGQTCPLDGGTIEGGLNIICYGASPKDVKSLTPLSVTPSYIYTWQYSEDGGINWENYDGGNLLTTPPAIILSSFTKPITQIRREISYGSCEKMYSNIITIKVNPRPQMDDITSPQIYNNGENVPGVSFSTSITSHDPVTYEWKVTSGDLKYLSPDMVNSGTDDFPSFTANNTSNAPYVATITVTPKIGDCPVPEANKKTFTIKVNPEPTMNDISKTASQIVCSGDQVNGVTFSTDITSSEPELTYEWTATGEWGNISSGAASGTGNFPSFTAKANASNAPYVTTITVTPKIGTRTGIAKTFTITVNPEPKVNTVSGTTVCSGGTVAAINFGTTIDVGTPVTYSWEVIENHSAITDNLLQLNGNGNIPEFTVKENTGTEPINIKFKVTPKIGNCSADTPEEFTIKVNPEPTMNIPETASQTVCSGDQVNGVTFSTDITSSEPELTYEWTATGEWGNISSGAASGTGNFPGFTAKANASNAPYVTTITVTPKIGTRTGIAKTFTITVNPEPKVNTVSGTTVCSGGTVAAINFGTTIAGTPVTYLWEVIENYSVIIDNTLQLSGNGNIPEFTVKENTGTEPINIKFKVTPKIGNCPVGTSEEFTVTVNPKPKVNPVSGTTVCSGGTVAAITFGTTIAGTPVTYLWEVMEHHSAIIDNTLSLSSNGNIPEFQVKENTGTEPINIRFTVTPKIGSCPVGTSEEFTVTVNPKPKMNDVSDITVDSGGSIAGVTFGTPITSPTVTYEWTATGEWSNISSGAASGTGNFPGFIAKANTSNAPYKATVTVTPKIGDCPSTVEKFTITVNPEPQMNEIPATASQSVCSDGAISGVTFSTPITSPTVTYKWTATGDYSEIGLEQNGTGDFVGFTAKTNTSDASYVAIITVTPTIGSHAAPASNQRSFTITVRPEPKITNIVPAITSQTVCSGEAIDGVRFGTSITPAELVTYEWTATGDWDKISSEAASGAGDFPGFTAKTNTSDAPYVATITVTPKIGSCIGTPKEFTISVNPFAKDSDIVPGDAIICSGSTAKLTASSSIANAVYKWYSSQDAETPFHTGDEYTTPELTANATFYVSVSGDGYCENLAGNRRAVTVKVNPLPELTSSLHYTIYSGSVFNYTAVSSIEGTEFSWIRADVADVLQLGTAGTTGVIAETLDNTGKKPVEAKYLITLTSPDGCTSTYTVAATVNPKAGPPEIVSQPAESVTYSVCEYSGVLEVTAKTVEGATLSYQWYSNTVASIEGGTPCEGAVDRVFSIPTGLLVGAHYYYCEVRSDYCATPTYSKITKVNIESGEARFKSLFVNKEQIPLQNSASEYMAYCEEDYVELNVVASSQYAIVTVDGAEYVPNIRIPLDTDTDVTEIKIRVVSCDGKAFEEHTVFVMKALTKLIFQRWKNSLAVNLNPVYNDDYNDIRGVRWYKNNTLLKEQLQDNSVAVREWIIKLDAPTEAYRAEVNVNGRWHRVCGEPVRYETVNKVYPNPVSRGENLTVELSSATPKRVMNIISLSGSVAQRNIPLSSTVNTINVAGFDPGIYILQIIDNPEQQDAVSKTVKIIVN